MTVDVKMTVRLPNKLHKRLKQRAQSENQSLNAVIVEALQQSIEQEGTVYETQEDQAWRLMREKGLWEPLGPAWDEYLKDAPDISHQELREMLKGVPPLSEIIIEDRGPRE